MANDTNWKVIKERIRTVFDSIGASSDGSLNVDTLCTKLLDSGLNYDKHPQLRKEIDSLAQKREIKWDTFCDLVSNGMLQLENPINRRPRGNFVGKGVDEPTSHQKLGCLLQGSH